MTVSKSSKPGQSFERGAIAPLKQRQINPAETQTGAINYQLRLPVRCRREHLGLPREDLSLQVAQLEGGRSSGRLQFIYFHALDRTAAPSTNNGEERS